ncbi:formyltetrahydrofolate deformylase [Glaciimonas sp. PAMC28666]|uniref:formyltetrahydrofolate deformylase n=1 Tax=Glaciimonas sp. PAMC28666 TaxID=2807626 RepID=UPI00196549FB|nr:formyltetrahydrofolate deformylase [Glaciimonas sp. PAMC28666]QRX81508.1 formyltetrahydrofolate deformylase [Glaciimonas sp. PAMC28666]
MKNTSIYGLTLSCPSEVGQVAAVVKFLADRQCYIAEIAVFDDDDFHTFFLRCIFRTPKITSTQTGDLVADDYATLCADFSVIAEQFGMQWQIHDMHHRPRVVVMVSKLDHCLADLLFRWKMGELPMDFTAIISNHADLAPLAAAHDIPFHYLPVTPATKERQEAEVLSLIEGYGAELIVLARYMQIFSEETSARLRGKAINIHHSFLPSFKGAKPYHQAYQRGVKLIGATAHFITDDLDEGPIIEQAVERVDHTYTPEKLLAVGRDVECLALSRAVQYFIEHRLFINANRTVILQ